MPQKHKGAKFHKNYECQLINFGGILSFSALVAIMRLFGAGSIFENQRIISFWYSEIDIR